MKTEICYFCGEDIEDFFWWIAIEWDLYEEDSFRLEALRNSFGKLHK